MSVFSSSLLELKQLLLQSDAVQEFCGNNVHLLAADKSDALPFIIIGIDDNDSSMVTLDGQHLKQPELTVTFYRDASQKSKSGELFFDIFRDGEACMQGIETHLANWNKSGDIIRGELSAGRAGRDVVGVQFSCDLLRRGVAPEPPLPNYTLAGRRHIDNEIVTIKFNGVNMLGGGWIALGFQPPEHFSEAAEVIQKPDWLEWNIFDYGISLDFNVMAPVSPFVVSFRFVNNEHIAGKDCILSPGITFNILSDVEAYYGNVGILDTITMPPLEIEL